ncbi:MAG TPA: hypothetical protein PKV15_07485 [Syntrophomonadaceae bacterium]|jgi:hypothetical protein|nr:hypothetical protein [Syntrophomonadaceae bacterium]HRX21393.1 hypothetical protein [Syntrophomonadaceae bacterium]
MAPAYLLKGVGKYTQLLDYIKNMDINNVPVVTDKSLKILLKKDIRKIYAQLKGGTSTQDHA